MCPIIKLHGSYHLRINIDSHRFALFVKLLHSLIQPSVLYFLPLPERSRLISKTTLFLYFPSASNSHRNWIPFYLIMFGRSLRSRISGRVSKTITSERFYTFHQAQVSISPFFISPVQYISRQKHFSPHRLSKCLRPIRTFSSLRSSMLRARYACAPMYISMMLENSPIRINRLLSLPVEDLELVLWPHRPSL